MADAPEGKRDFSSASPALIGAGPRWLARMLTEEGYTFWYQDQDFAGSVARNIAEAHANSNRTIVLLSDAYAGRAIAAPNGRCATTTTRVGRTTS